jgi:hypothetical protein
MKNLLNTLFLFAFISSFAQESVLKFDKKIYGCENNWITYPLKEKDTTYMLGYVYIDRSAGLTFHFENRFKISSDGKFVPLKKDNASRIITRIQNLNTICAIIPSDKFKDLEILETPEFMKSYINSNEADDLVERAFQYNHIGASFLAVPLLEKAQKINPNAKNLLFELGYAYNATDEFDKCITLLHIGISKQENNNWLLYKELIFALSHNNQLENAEVAFKNGMKIKEKSYIDETAFNIAQGYFNKKDKKKFEEWKKIAKEYSTKADSPVMENLELMSKELKL